MLLDVSRPFLIKQTEAGALAYPARRLASSRHPRCLKDFKPRMQVSQAQAPQRSADNAAELGLEYWSWRARALYGRARRLRVFSHSDC